MEDRLEEEKSVSIKKEKEIREEYQSQLEIKDQELKVSRDQISQLLRIIEQITINQKSSPVFNSKQSDSDDTNWIVVREQLEISDESTEKPLGQGSSIANYYSKEGNYGIIKLKELEWLSSDTDAKLQIPAPSPTLSNISEGMTGIYVDEVQRNVVKNNEIHFENIEKVYKKQ